MSNDIPLGQLGSGFLDDVGTLSPPTGKVVIAITMLDNQKFTVLTPEVPTDSTFKGPVVAATGASEVNCIGIATQTAANGTNSETIAADTTLFPKGLTIYGRWTSVQLEADADGDGAICYYGY